MKCNFRSPARCLLVLFVVVYDGCSVCMAVDDKEALKVCSIDGACQQENDVGLESGEKDLKEQQHTLTSSGKNDTAESISLACQDLAEGCKTWAKNGECTKNPAYMILNCQKSCQLCPYVVNDNGSNCKDKNEECASLATRGDCGNAYMEENCRLSCMQCSKIRYSHSDLLHGVDLGVQQATVISTSDPNSTIVQDRIVSSRIYRKSAKQIHPSLKKMCLNRHEKCSVWAVNGECDKNPNFMKQNCAPACFSCEYLSVEKRCPIDPNEPNVWGPGDLDRLFTRLSTEPYYLSKYNTQILSSPHDNNPNHHHQPRRPWIITMENVISTAEAEVLIQVGGDSNGGYKRSPVGKHRDDGTYEPNVNTNRTSHHTWCRQGSPCEQNELVRGVLKRLTNITSIPLQNSESLQLLRYEPDQFYGVHHDYLAHQIKRQQGVRVLTLYLHLNDVEAGGGTNFDKLNLTVMPKKGRALLWPSVLNDYPNERDDWTTHQALPVEAGIKYGANAWFHMRDFQTPLKLKCVN